MTGKIIKGIAGFYYVHTVESGIYECKAKGIFRKNKTKPLVGDNVEIDILDADKKIGNVVKILERKNELVRPSVANIDQAVIIFSIVNPKPNFNLLDRFLATMEYLDIEAVICFNKKDIAPEEDLEYIKNEYGKTKYKIIYTSTKLNEGIDELKEVLYGKTSTVAGPSGVGKSSIINLLQSEIVVQTGEISEKIERGKHTTRHSEIININDNTYIMDTPGFTSFYLDGIEANELRNCFPEFFDYEDKCRFNGCVHVNEPDCGIKAALNNGKISKLRYENYKELYNELKSKKKY